MKGRWMIYLKCVANFIAFALLSWEGEVMFWLS
jgi:hypothetical protein